MLCLIFTCNAKQKSHIPRTGEWWEKMQKIRAPLCSTGQDQHFSTFSSGQVAPGEKKWLQQFQANFQPAFLRKLWKNGNKHLLCDYFLERLSWLWLRGSLIFFSTSLHRILNELFLESHYHKTLLVLSGSIALLSNTDKAKQIHCHCPDSGGAGGARPRQLPCPD